MSQQFASDNNAGICPQAMQAMARADATGHELSYGDDRWTKQVCDRFRELFETNCDVYFVFNGTAANSLGLASLTRSYHGVICHRLAHVATDECGAPEFFSGGAKLLTLDSPDGKLLPADVAALVTKRSDMHFPKPKALSVTQCTELGTVYTPDELHGLAEVARRHGLKMHMDGARFANAVASLGANPADITWRAGVDVLCFGGTKNGMAVGEAVIFFDKTLAEDFAWRAKQAGQLASKMRYISAPWLGLLDQDVWLRHAGHANAMARRLADKITAIPGIELMYRVEANGVFVQIDPAVQGRLKDKGWQFYSFIGAGGCRLMCAWDTSPETVDRFAADVATVSKA